MKRYAYPALLLVLLGLVLAPLLLQPGSFVYPRGGKATDLTITHWPAIAYNQRSLREHGQVPLWRTTIAGGGPWAANPQSWLFYPPAWLSLILPIPWTLNLLLLSHLALAALATYALARRALGLKPAAAALAGLAFALTPWISGHLSAGHINVILALAWLPVALTGAHLAATTGKPGGALLASLAWAAALLNHPQMAIFGAALTMAWFLLVMLTAKTQASRGRRTLLLVLIPVLSLLLGAILLIPMAEALPYLNRTTITVEEAGLFSLSWPQLLTTLVPGYGGEPEQAIYLGLPIVVLAIAGLVLRHNRFTWFFAITAVLAIIFSLGTNGPLFPLLFRLVPGLSWFRVPARAWGLVAFSLAMLAACGLDALLVQKLAPATGRRVILVGLAALVTGLILAGGLALLNQPPPLAVWVLAALTMLTVTGLILRARSVIGPGPFMLLVLLLVAADLGLVRAAWVEMRSPAEAFAWGAETAQFLAEQPGQFRTYSPSYSLPQHTAVYRDLFLADGVDPLQLAYYANFLALAGGYEAGGYSVSLPPTLDDTSARPDADRLGLLNVGYVASGFAIEAEGLRPRAELEGTYIYENDRLLPRAFVTGQAQPPSGQEIALSWPIEPQPAQISVYTPNHIVVEADTAAPGMLVLGEVWYPGWRALDNGSPVPIHRVEGALRGVYLDAGQHTVEFQYTPWTVGAGVAVSGLCLLLLGVYAGILWRRQR